MRLFEIDGEVTIECFGERCRLIGSACENSLREHRVEDIVHADSDSAQEIEIELRVVKDLDDGFIDKNLGEPSELHSFAQRNEQIKISVRKLDRENFPYREF